MAPRLDCLFTSMKTGVRIHPCKARQLHEPVLSCASHTTIQDAETEKALLVHMESLPGVHGGPVSNKMERRDQHLTCLMTPVLIPSHMYTRQCVMCTHRCTYIHCDLWFSIDYASGIVLIDGFRYLKSSLDTFRTVVNSLFMPPESKNQTKPNNNNNRVIATAGNCYF